MFRPASSCDPYIPVCHFELPKIREHTVGNDLEVLSMAAIETRRFIGEMLGHPLAWLLNSTL